MKYMKINEIDPKNLKANETEQTLWYRGDKGDLFIIFSENKILHFEVTIGERHLEGGIDRSMRYGLVDPDEHIKDAMQFKRSRMVSFNNDIPKGFVDEAIEVVFQSENLEKSMKEGIMTFLSTQGSDDRGLKLEEGRYDSFREIVPPPFDFLGFIRRHWKSAFSVLLLVLIGVFVTTYYQNEKLEKACKEGDNMACLNVGLMDVIQGKKRHAKSVFAEKAALQMEQMKSACEAGSMDDCYKVLNAEIKKGTKTQKDIEQLHPKACQKGHHIGCYVMAKDAYFKGNVDEAMKLFEISCAKNYKDSCDYVLIEKQYKFNLEQCDNGDKEACHKAALKEIDDGKSEIADGRLQKNCEVGHASSCTILADLSARNKQVGRAQGLYLKACDMNDLKSCFNYRYMTASDRQAKRMAEAMWKDCQNGNESSCLELKKIK